MSLVSLLKCNSYEFEEVYNTIKKSLENIGGIDFVKDKIILLKPNLLAPVKPEKAVCTNPIFVKAVIRLFKEAGAKKILVGDSPGIGTQGTIYNITGIKKVVEEEGAEIANFKDKIEKEVENYKIVKKFTFAKAVEDADYIISLPKLKTHGMTYYTGAIKNLFGLVPGILKPKFHYMFPEKEDFSEMLVDLNIAVKPIMAIMDGILAMEGNGPRNGTPFNLNLVLASKDLVALDSTACRIIGLNPKNIMPVLKAYERKMGELEEDKISVIGKNINEVQIKKFKKIKKEVDVRKLLPLPNFLNKIIKDLLLPKPYFDMKKCILCNECVNVCPTEPKSLENKDKKIIINRKTCIRCFCCQEMCPVGAISPKRFL